MRAMAASMPGKREPGCQLLDQGRGGRRKRSALSPADPVAQRRPVAVDGQGDEVLALVKGQDARLRVQGNTQPRADHAASRVQRFNAAFQSQLVSDPACRMPEGGHQARSGSRANELLLEQRLE